jgi:hypothetical protein
MYEFLEQNSLLIVMIITLVIWAGLYFELIRIDKRIQKLEDISHIEMIENKANVEDVLAYLNDRNIPADEITLMNLSEQILKNPPKIGYLTISNALQWRLQYSRIMMLKDKISGITKIIDKC